MSHNHQIGHKYRGNCCELLIDVKRHEDNLAGPKACLVRHVHNIRNCDLFIDDYNFLIYLDVRLYQFQTSRCFDLKDIKHIEINYNTKDHLVAIDLPCLPLNEIDIPDSTEKIAEKYKQCDSSSDMWKLKKITEQCYIRVDNSKILLKPESNFDYGFASKFVGPIRPFECDFEAVTRIAEPASVSPLQRTINRIFDEMKCFSRDQYKLNFVELQIPEGHDNPMLFKVNFKDSVLSKDEKCLLHNITCKPDLMEMPDEYDLNEVDCCLISILLGICYDVKFTSNEPNCESAWTRSVLSATITYFESFTSLQDVVVSFMRRSLVYPLYRNYELGRECVEDCITALQSNSAWILKQLLITRDIFEANDRSVFNYYYIDDYIRYLSNPNICTGDHLQMLGHNLKNVLLDISRKHLGLGLQELETELLKDLITDIHISNSSSEDNSEDPDDDNDVGTESCESEFCTSADSESESISSDTEEDSVIEQRMDNLKL